MLGKILRLIASGVTSRGLGDYLKEFAEKYLVMSAAGMVFLAAAIFGLLAAFWAITSSIHDPAISAAIMAGILVLIGLLTLLGAYGIGQNRAQNANQEPAPADLFPTPEDVGRQIRNAARTYGPLRVTAAAAAGGLVSGLIASRLGLVGTPPEAREDRRANGKRSRRRYA